MAPPEFVACQLIGWLASELRGSLVEDWALDAAKYKANSRVVSVKIELQYAQLVWKHNKTKHSSILKRC